MQKCSICKIEKKKTEFNFRDLKTKQYYKHCRSCQRLSRQRSYEKNKEYYLAHDKEAIKQRRISRMDFIKMHKENKSCKDCEKFYPHYVLDFDHLPQFKKEFEISSQGKYHSKEVLLKEFAKCDIVCANCHRMRTWQRQKDKIGG